VCGTRETVVSCISRLILESGQEGPVVSTWPALAAEPGGFRPMEEFQSNTAENSASKRDAGRKANLTSAGFAVS
jgi:hypothetical protein